MKTERNLIQIAWLAALLVFLMLILTVNQSAKADAFIPTGSMNIGRTDFAATLLTNGLVLVAGGYGTNTYLSSCELYNPANGTWTLTGNMSIARMGLNLTLLNNGMVLVSGGVNNFGPFTNTEIYNPVDGSWHATGNLNTPRSGQATTLLTNGWVLVAGGDSSTGAITNAELYDPNSGTWTVTGPLVFHHGSLTSSFGAPTMTLLPDGTVLLAGGVEDATNNSGAETYNPITQTWTATQGMVAPRCAHSTAFLASGSVLVSGGLDPTNDFRSLASSEIYNPINRTWTLSGALTTPRGAFSMTALPSGQVLAAGGYSQTVVSIGTFHIPTNNAEVFNPTTGAWTPASMTMSAARTSHTATLLPNGNVLVSGGRTSSGSLITSSCDRYIPDPVILSVTLTPPGAVSAGAQWQLDGGTFQNSGSVVTNLTVGNHTISFSTVSGWITPSNQIISLNPSVTNSATGNYIALPSVGALRLTLDPTGAAGAGAQWQVDGSAFQDSGAVVTNLAVGNHTVSFNAIQNWISPNNQTVTVTFGNTNTTTGTYLPSGALQFTINPTGAVSAGAQWQLDGGPFQNSGAILNRLSVGDHTVSFSSVFGWVTPSNQTMTITFATTNVVATTYLPAVGDLQVNINPTDAVSAGAQWRLDGGTFQSSGTILTNVPVGSHTVSFNTVGGWLTPGNIAASVAFNSTNTYSANYTIAPGAVQVTILPPEAVPAGAAWRLDGGTLQSSGATLFNVSNGDHTVSFVNITGWSTATNQTVSVSPGSTATATGYYTPQDGLQVTITPSCVVADGAQWQVDGGAFQNSGATVTNLVPGKHIVSFKLVGGWTAPVNQTVTITIGSTTNAIGNYRLASISGTIIWVNAGANQNWNNPTNWDLLRIPTNTDIVLIPHVTGTNCVLNIDAAIAGLQIGYCDKGDSDGLNLNAHTLAVTGPITIQPGATLTLDQYSTLIGTNAVLSGALGWTLGTLTGTFTIANNGVLNITNGGNSHYLPNCIVTNYGTVNWSRDNLLGGGSSPGTLIYNYGLWNAQDDQRLGANVAGNGIVFNNFGTFRKSGGANGSFSEIQPGTVFNNSGVVDVQQGNLHLLGGGIFSGGYITTNTTSSTVLASGNFTVNGTMTGTNFIQGGATLTNLNVINGGLTWLNGTWNGAVTINSNSVVNIYSGGNSHYLPNCVITNWGTVNWSGDNLLGGGSSPGTLIYNYGLWNVQGDGVLGVNVAGNGIVFDNFGIVRKSGTSGTSEFRVTFTNTGTLDMQAGIVSLTVTYNLLGGTLQFGLNDLINYGRLTLNNSVALGGQLKVNVGSTFAPAIGSQFQIISAASRSGVFSSVDLPPGLAVIYNPNSVLLNVSSAVPVQILQPQLVGANLFFQFPTASGQSYTVQQNTNLTTTDWFFYTNVTGSGSLLQIVVPAKNYLQNFFRISEP